MTSQEKKYSDHSFETSKVSVFLAGVKAKGSQGKWQRIQGVLAHLFSCAATQHVIMFCFFSVCPIRLDQTEVKQTKPNHLKDSKTVCLQLAGDSLSIGSHDTAFAPVLASPPSCYSWLARQ